MAEAKPKLLIVEDDQGLQAQLKWAYDDFEVIIAGDRASDDRRAARRGALRGHA